MSEKNDLPALFKHYPDLKENVPWISLGSFPTPVQQLKNLECDNLWIKRDDQTSTVYGGNKVRKLEFLLADVIKKKARRVITFGAIGTNHGLATSIYSQKLGLDCTLLLFWQPVTKNVKQNLLLFTKYHAKAVYKKTVLKTRLSCHINFSIWSFDAYLLVRPHINNSVLVSARMVTLSRSTRFTVSVVWSPNPRFISPSYTASQRSCVCHVGSEYPLDSSKHARNLKIRLHSRSPGKRTNGA